MADRTFAWLAARTGWWDTAGRADDAAVLLFTSGSEGQPKGVALSHANLLANCAQAAARIDFNALDKCLVSLPLFHSFGLTASFLLPLLRGVGVYLYPSPLHYRAVPEAFYGSNATVLFGTDSFLRGYGRMADPFDFHALRYVFAGAEPLQEETRGLWSDRFGRRILVGYGATETAPVLALNTPMHHRAGTVGRFLPGIAWRLEPVEGLARGGRLWVKGPNVMLGYLLADRPGVLQPPAEGWYDTGDLVEVDGEGFVTVIGRARRFAKIAGEMISLAAVETAVAAASASHRHAIVAPADPRRGQRLVLATTDPDMTRERVLAAIRAAGLGPLAMPGSIVQAARLPLLATGKIDYPAVERLVGERSG
ncbi:MAG: AMP-binding protein [Alphaproteobacteria bacterium]|nr:AMP-binding protein [Alphaproteobacteria bacterium]